VETDNEHLRAKVSRNGDKLDSEALKQFIRRFMPECNKPALQILELDNRILRAELRRDVDSISLMRRSIRESRARLSRGKYAKAMQRMAVLRGALNDLPAGRISNSTQSAGRTRLRRQHRRNGLRRRREHRRNGLGRQHIRNGV
jgi:hypothetical protein